jgi:hypothetical protein
MEAQNSSSSATQQLIQATYSGLSRPLNASEIELLSTLERLKHFLATAPSRWSSSSSSGASTSYAQGQHQPQASNHSSTLASLTTAPTHPALNRFLLPSGEYISCVLWSGLYHITGTDIVRALVYRFEAFGRPVTNMKKFEEGVFSDLRNLKPGTDACLEEPKVRIPPLSTPCSPSRSISFHLYLLGLFATMDLLAFREFAAHLMVAIVGRWPDFRTLRPFYRQGDGLLSAAVQLPRRTYTLYHHSPP